MLNLTIPPFPKLLFPASLVFVESFASCSGMKLAWFQANNSKEASMKFAKPVLITAIVSLLAILLLAFNVINNSLAVTDPDDPRFDVSKFRYENYRETNDHFRRKITKIFPIGTDKFYVDKILVKQAGARAPSPNDLTEYHNPGDTDYTYIKGSWLVRFIFDNNNKTVMMKMGKPIYGTDPVETFWKEKGYGRKQ